MDLVGGTVSPALIQCHGGSVGAELGLSRVLPGYRGSHWWLMRPLEAPPHRCIQLDGSVWLSQAGLPTGQTWHSVNEGREEERRVEEDKRRQLRRSLLNTNLTGLIKVNSSL